MSTADRRTWILSNDPAVAAAAVGIADAAPATELRVATPTDLVVFDTAAPPAAASSTLAIARAQILCHNLAVDPLIRLWAQFPGAYLLGKRGPAITGDVAHAVGVMTGGGHGATGFLRDGTSVVTVNVGSQADADGAVALVQAQAAVLQGYNDFAEAVATGAMELLMNARRAAGPAPVTLRFGSDGQVFAVSVADPAGALTRAIILENLVRCAKRGDDQIRTVHGSAGLGLYMVLVSASSLEFRVTPGRSTVVTFASRILPTMREFDSEPRSLTFQVETP